MTNDEWRVTRLRQGSGAASPPSHDYGLGYLFSAKGAAFSTSPPHRTDSPWRTWGSAPGCHVTQKCSSAESAIHFCRDFVSIISTALISTGSIFEKHRGIEGALSALDLSNNRFPGAMPQAQAQIAPLALTRTASQVNLSIKSGLRRARSLRCIPLIASIHAGRIYQGSARRQILLVLRLAQNEVKIWKRRELRDQR
jgi:hypothetical protein